MNLIFKSNMWSLLWRSRSVRVVFGCFRSLRKEGRKRSTHFHRLFAIFSQQLDPRPVFHLKTIDFRSGPSTGNDYWPQKVVPRFQLCLTGTLIDIPPGAKFQKPTDNLKKLQKTTHSRRRVWRFHSGASAGHGTFLKFAKYDQKWPKLDKKGLFWAVFCKLDPKNHQSHPQVTPCICSVGKNGAFKTC